MEPAPEAWYNVIEMNTYILKLFETSAIKRKPELYLRIEGGERISTDSSEEYIQRIVDVYSGMLIRVACANIGSPADAEDIVQDVFVRLIKAQPRFQNTEHEKAWLIRVTVNLCKNHLKSGWHTRTTALEETAAAEAPDSILDVVMQLPQNYRTVIYLHYYEGYSTREMAAMLRRRHSTVCSWLARARARLKDLLGEWE